MLLEKYKYYPQIIQNTRYIVEASSFEFDFKTPKNKKFTESKENDFLLLKQLAYEGLHKRYGINHLQAIERVEKELAVINQLNFCAYF